MNKQIHIRYSPSLETLCLILKAKIVIITCSCWISLERSFSGNPNTFNSIQLLYIFHLNGPLISSYKSPYSFDSWTVGKNCWVNQKKVFLFKSKFKNCIWDHSNMKCFQSIQRNVAAMGLVPSQHPNNRPQWDSRQILCTIVHIVDTWQMSAYIILEVWIQRLTKQIHESLF